MERVRIPSNEECEALYEEVCLPAHIRAHCRAVARRALALLEEAHPAYHFDPALVEAGALLHDILRLQSCHDQVGEAFLREKGYPALARIVGSHMFLSYDMRVHIDERAIVFLADKMVQGDTPCTIRDRYRAAVAKGADPAEMEKAAERAEALYAAIANGPEA